MTPFQELSHLLQYVKSAVFEIVVAYHEPSTKTGSRQARCVAGMSFSMTSEDSTRSNIKFANKNRTQVLPDFAYEAIRTILRMLVWVQLFTDLRGTYQRAAYVFDG